MKALIGTKLGMTQFFDSEGNVVRGTVIAGGPCVVTQVKTRLSDGYNAVQLGFGSAGSLNRPQMGHFKAANASPSEVLEVRLPDVDPAAKDAETEVQSETADLNLKVGDKLDATVFEVGDKVTVVGTSKGKGFAGTVKRHNFATGPKTHGSHNYRAPGSIGSGYPEHVFKGMRMAGRMGGAKTTVKGLKVVAVSPEQNLVVVSGAVPGPRKGTVMIKGVL